MKYETSLIPSLLKCPLDVFSLDNFLLHQSNAIRRMATESSIELDLILADSDWLRLIAKRQNSPEFCGADENDF